MHDHRPAAHVLVFYWCIWLIDVTSLKVGRRLERLGASRQRQTGRDAGEPAADSLEMQHRVPNSARAA